MCRGLFVEMFLCFWIYFRFYTKEGSSLFIYASFYEEQCFSWWLFFKKETTCSCFVSSQQSSMFVIQKWFSLNKSCYIWMWLSSLWSFFTFLWCKVYSCFSIETLPLSAAAGLFSVRLKSDVTLWLFVLLWEPGDSVYSLLTVFSFFFAVSPLNLIPSFSFTPFPFWFSRSMSAQPHFILY